MILEYISRYFKNNGYLRGSIYTATAVLTVVAEKFAIWKDTPPKNWYEIGLFVVVVVIAGLNALRAFLDGHLARVRKEREDVSDKQPATPTP